MAEKLTRVVSMVNNYAIGFKYAKVKPDVCVYTPLNEYRLHSQVLQLCSPWFANSFADACWSGVENRNNPDSPLMFKYEYSFVLVKDGSYVLEPGKKKQSFAAQSPTTTPACESLGNIFKCFYRQSLVFSPSITPKDLLFLIDTAEKYDALEACRAAIHGALFNIVDIDEKVCKSPVSYLFIAYKLESTMLFPEAFIHTVGQWHIDNFPTIEDNPIMPKEIVTLVEAESKRLTSMIISVTKSLFAVNTKSENILSRMQCSFARILVLDEVNKAFVGFSKSGKEGMLFNRLNDFKQSYTNYTVETHDQFCSNRLGRNRCSAIISSELSMEFLRNWVGLFLRSHVQELVVNNLRLKRKCEYLTCTNPTDDMMPWLVDKF
ncbi:hypothetical protein RUND412_002848 [Rhizina undulata]